MPRGAKTRSKKAFLTTHDVAQLLNVSLPTVVNWIDGGKMSAHRTPGGHRRIAREELLRFSQAFDYPLPGDFVDHQGPARILVIDADPDMGEMLRDFLVARTRYEIRVASGVFEAGYLLGSLSPDVVILDTTMPGMDARRALEIIRSARRPRPTRVIAGAVIRDARSAALLKEFDGQLTKPIRWDALLETLRGLLT